MSRENRSKYALLGALALGPKSGYDVKRFFEASVGNFWQESFGQIYPLLAALVRDGHAVEVPAADGGGRGRERRVYAITDAGRALLARWVAEPAAPSVLRVEILLKLFFARLGDADAVRRTVVAFRASQQEALDRYACIDATLPPETAAADAAYWRMTLDYGRRTSDALVAWADASLATLDRIAGGAR